MQISAVIQLLMRTLVCAVLCLAGFMVLAAQARSACQQDIAYPLAATNAEGEILVAWQVRPSTRFELCGSALTDAAIGSTESGFADVGAVSAADTLSYPTDTFLDGAGNGWIVGVHQVSHYEKYGPTYENVGAWFAFRPAGAGFQAPTELPIKGSESQSSAFVAGNRAGKTVLAWSTERGTYLAWGTPTGGISAPTFYGRGFQVSGLGVDESGRALIVGYYPGRLGSTEIAVVSAGASGSFSQPRALAVRRRNRRKHLVGYLGQPVVGIGPNGNAVIGWRANWLNPRTAEEYAGPSLLLYRQADGHFDKPVRLPKVNLERAEAVKVDGAGRGIIVLLTERGLREVTVAPSGRIGPERPLPGSSAPSVASNPLGQTVIAWGLSSVEIVLGDTQGLNGAPQTIATPLIYGLFVTIDARGVATVLWIAEDASHATVLDARSITPGAKTVEVASSELATMP